MFVGWTSGSDIHFYFSPVLHNFGVGPADIMDYIAEAELFDSPALFQAQINDPPILYRENEVRRLNDSLIAPGEEVQKRIHATITISPTEDTQITNDTKRIGIHGRIRYRGAPEHRYTTRFFWWYFRDDNNFFRCLTPEYNSHD